MSDVRVVEAEMWRMISFLFLLIFLFLRF